MLGKEIIMKELTRVDFVAESSMDIFDKMGPTLQQLGYVNEKYISSIKAREEKYPTALPTEPHPIAIPHTDVDAIERPFIAPIRLAHPIPWVDMSDHDVTHEVELVFMLGFKEAGAHIELLQILMHNVMHQDWIESLLAADDVDAFYDAVVQLEWTHD